MTKQVNELMAQVNDLLFAPNHLRKRKSQELRTALEAALKPCEPFGYVNTHTGQFFKDVEDCRKNNEGHWRTVYTDAPPAQTPVPPRLTDEQRLEIFHSVRPRNRLDFIKAYMFAVETAVRKQFGVNDE